MASPSASVDKWLARRNKALAELDLSFAKQEYPEGSDEVLLVALHKARVDCTDLPDPLRLDSVEWLRERGFSRVSGLPLPPVGELPE